MWFYPYDFLSLYPFYLHQQEEGMNNNQEKITETLSEITELLSCKDSYQGLFHQHKEGEPIPSANELLKIVNLLRSIIFPGYYGKSSICCTTLKYHTGVNLEKVYDLLTKQIYAGICFGSHLNHEIGDEKCQVCGEKEKGNARTICNQFIKKLPYIRQILATDVLAAYNGDPAATSYAEIIACYPAIKAITNYRIAHELYEMGVPLIPRMITEMAHSETGIDIHPAAKIGQAFSIDHGTGVVIGATSIIGKHVTLYQGVTLGALSFPLDDQGNPIKGIERHPILEDNVICYSNSTILGRVTIGQDAIIGGNIWITGDVARGAKIVQPKANKNL